MTKLRILNVDGKERKTIDRPKFFSAKIRDDIVSKIIETKKVMQPYAPSEVAGRQQNAKGQLVHRRHVWKSQYGRGQSRIPRKQMSRRGTQFNWVGAYSPNTRKGYRAHPPKVVARINTSKINKKEMKIAFLSALTATANAEMIQNRYERLRDKRISEVPFVVEDKFVGLKAKEKIDALKKILGELYEVALKKKTVRAGKGKMRGRKYKSNAGVLVVVGKNEKIKATGFEMKNAKELNVIDLAKGGLGRVVVYTENAIKDLEERMGEKK